MFIFAFLVLPRLYAQEFTEEMIKNSKSKNALTIEGFSYPLFLDNETHSNFTVAYEFDPTFLIELEGFYDTYRLYDIYESRLLLKKYLSNRFYFFTGLGTETELDKHGFKPPPTRIKTFNGFGYEVDEKFSLEAKHDLHFNKTNFGNYGTPNLFSLGGKYKF